MTEQLSGKTAVVTGASSGIGAAIVEALINAGANVVLAARSEDKMKSIVQDIGREERMLSVATDMTNRKEVENLASQARETFGQVDIYVNCAGKMGSSTVKNGDVEDWDQMIDLNVKSVLYGIHSVLNGMMDRKSGHIVNIASDSGFEVIPRLTVYCATKFAVRAISTGLEKELTNTGVRITNVSPGMVDTSLSSESPFEDDRKKLEPKDIAQAVVYAVTQPAHVNVNEVTVRPV
ncbi:SDR family oxidoreductase [Salinicoccus sp. ID82-1]|uniref:SDR family oxidoreductase n=1 Tax=Salinicoccus sp. ID82-1 TaxID=2820269 RepID=UPI001F3630CC|nr:SDR family oxidoreductase [Salinicoccus sp. ID82-1]MCG1008933.1 SDR family oxidoreductase [Salinicoccus sp. ID82-1]